MGASCKSIVRNPRTPANLKNLEKVLVRCEIDAAPVVGLNSAQLKKDVVELLKDEGVKTESNARAKLVVAVGAESRAVPPSLVYAVEVALREPAALARTGASLQAGSVDSWRHQTITGVVFPPFDSDKLARALTQEALRQVSEFLEDWSAENVSTRDDSNGDDNGPTRPSQPSDPQLEKIRAALESILAGLGVGDASTAKVEQLSMTGTIAHFRATITHRQKASAVERPFLGKYRYSIDTTAEGQFDVANPASLNNLRVCTKLPPLLGSHEVCVPLGGLAAAIA